MLKLTMTIAAALTLSACMDGASVSRSELVQPNSARFATQTTSRSCAAQLGASAQFIQGQNVRCGPQTVLPYTLR